jgi:uncharacterized protein YggU (UPF0235/DUF167 family)
MAYSCISMALIHIKITPSANEDSVTKKTDTSFIVKTKGPAQENRVNRVMIGLLSAYLGITRSKLKIITGHHYESKILEILE